MKYIFVVTVLLCSATAIAQCPVEFINVGFNAYTHKFLLRSRNISGKTITGMKIHVAYYDENQVLRDILSDWKWKKRLAPSAHDFQIRQRFNLPRTETGWKIWPTKVRFSDGTKWEGAGVCAYDEHM